MWWGVSPALDLLDEYEPANLKSEPDEGNQGEGEGDQGEPGEKGEEDAGSQEPEKQEEKRSEIPRQDSEAGEGLTYKVLLIGQYDNRHVLKTLAQKYRHSGDIDLKLYICEPLLENVARELLFTTLALEPSSQLGLAEKTKFFMELYGNSLIRPATSNYLIKVSKRLMQMITNFNYAQTILPSVSLDSLKYKERDQLETIFKYWASNDTSFDILTAWDQRIRKSLGTRYDLRVGVFDWDYHMRYRPYGADVLSAYEYKKFRERGMSFYYEDQDPTIPNRTIASAIFSAGSKILNYGYMGDIVTGPYVAYGFDCEDEDMLKKVNGYSRNTSTDITERNAMRIFHEIEHRCPFVPAEVDTEGNAPPAIVEDTSNKLKVSRQDSTRNIPSASRRRDDVETYTSILTDKTEIIFLPTTALKDYTTKPHFQNFFDLITIPQAMVFKHLTEDLLKIFKPDCKIIVDTPKYLLHYKKEDLEKFKNELEDLMTERKCKPLSSYDFKKDEFVRFQVAK